MIYWDIEQRTDEWLQIRAGKITASRISDILAVTASGAPKATRKNYIAELACERLSGEPNAPGYINKEMQWGIDHEEEALYEYEMLTGRTIKAIGFATAPGLEEIAGASPDGEAGGEGLVEVKCPLTATHLETLRFKKIKGSYIAQMQWEMFCAEKPWCDFVSFDPRIKTPELQLYIQRVARDDRYLEKIVIPAVKSASAEADLIIAELKRDYL